MRIRQKLVTAVLVVLMLTSSAARGFAQTAVMTLQAAAAQGLVDYQFEGTGSSSGDSVRVKVKRNPRAPDPFPITIPPGTILRSGGSAQSMAVSIIRGIDVGGGLFEPASRIVLSSTAWVTAILSAFCAEFEKDNPSASTPFTLEQPNPALACVLNASRSLSIATQQAAVWMHTDRLTYRHMSEKFPVSQAEWAAAETVIRRCNAPDARAAQDDRPAIAAAPAPMLSPTPTGATCRPNNIETREWNRMSAVQQQAACEREAARQDRPAAVGCIRPASIASSKWNLMSAEEQQAACVPVARPPAITREVRPPVRLEPPPPVVRLEPQPPRVTLQSPASTLFQRDSTSVSDLMSRLNGYWQDKSERDGTFNDTAKSYHVVETYDLAVQIVDTATGAMSAQFNHHQTFTENRGRPWNRDYRVDIELVVGQIGDSISAHVVSAEVRLNNQSSKLPAAVVRKFGIEQGFRPGDQLRVDIRYDANNWIVVLMNKY